MYYSSVVVFVLVKVINLSGIVTGLSQNNRNYGPPPNNPQDVVLNIGNGSYKTNVAVLEDIPNSVVSYQYGVPQSEGLGNRFGANPAYSENQPNPRPQRPGQYYYSQVNNNQSTQSSSSGDRTQTQGSTFYPKNKGGTSIVTSQGTGAVNAGYGTDNHNQINTNSRPIQPINSGGRTLQTQGSPYNARNYGGTSFVASQGTGVVNVGHGKDNHNQIVTNNRPIQPVLPMNSGGRTLQTQGSAHNARNNGGLSFVSPGGTDLFNVGYGIDNHNQILVDRRPSQRPAPVNGGRRTPQAQSADKTSNNKEQNAYINTVFVNGRSVQPDQNDGIWSTYYINNQRVQVLNTGRAQNHDHTSKNRDTQLKTLRGILAQILEIKSRLEQDAATLHYKH